MKTRSLLVSRLLLLVLVPILAEATFRIDPRSGNNVTLTDCTLNIYLNGAKLSENSYNLIVDGTTEGVYECGSMNDNDAFGTVTVLRQFVKNDTKVPKIFTWGQRQVLDCTGYVPGNYHEGYKVAWLLDGSQRCIKDSACEDNNFYINPDNFSLSFDYSPTFTTYECRIEPDIPGSLTNATTVASYTLSTSKNDQIQTKFIENMEPVLVENGMNKVKFSCSASVQSNASINFEVSDLSGNEFISPADCNVTTDNPTVRMCSKTLLGTNVNMTCNYSTSYQIDCTFSWNLINSSRRVYPVACHVNDSTTETSTRTGLIVRDDKKLPAPVSTYGDNNESLSSLSVSLPFNIPTSYVSDTIKLIVTFNNSNEREFKFNNMTLQDNQITVNLSSVDLYPGQYEVRYNLSFFDEPSEESLEEIITIAAPPIPSTSSLRPTTTTMMPSPSSMPSMSIPNISSTPTVGPVSPTSTITAVAAGIAGVTVIIFILIIILILLVIGNRCRKTNSKKINNKSSNGHQTGRGLEEGNNGKFELTNASLYNQHTDSSMLGANSAVSLINSDSPPHVHNGCNCSCHTRSTHSHSSGPSQSSTTSYHSRMQLTQQINYDMPRYGYPYTAEMPTTTTSMIMPQASAAPPSSLNLNQQVPSVQVQEPTPVMINVPNLVSPTGTLPFESDSEPNQDTPRPNRPTHLDIPENQKGRRHGDGSSTPVKDSIMLAVMLYLQHQNCTNRKHCPCCKMITKQFEKIAREQGQDTLDKAMKDIQTPGTEGHKQMLRRRGRTPRSPHRVGFHLGGDLKRQRSNSTSKVHDEELTFSSTETEEDEKSMRKARSSRKVHTDDEMDLFLPLSAALNPVNSKELASSEPELNTPIIAFPPSMTYSGITPTNPAPMKSKRDSSDESSGTDDISSSSSSRPNSNPRLDNIHPTDDTSKSLLLSSAATILGSSSNTAPYNSNKLSVENKHNSITSYSSGYVSSQSESEKEGKAPPPAQASTYLQPVHSDNELSDTDSYKESSPARLIPKTKREGRGPSPVLPSQAPPHRPQRPAPRLSDHRPPYPVATNGLHPHHASPSHKSSTISYHRQNRSMPGDSSSIHSSQSVRLIDSDHSSSGSTHSIHSDGAIYPPTGSHGHNHHHRHHHHHHSNRMGPRNNALHNSANVISLPSDASTSTAL
ncbi:PREDICTED: probable serine/threonine-protein kinase DDB_G0282963 [Amphimedon queenslandica]|uniref:Ig-like domain-containing protein n=1 Tax=Amphimedon queenslandica TaxID=400682 RepID=A0A1X7VI83_AMPQE|nr:PREDICTED: probable serine/threonine-protein kinase DDB_G0282963 [Amphimedon queenslandica]|eukprot:XP_019849015.1 PREDICTED: probable serine/threonine-protein kinase DDB_G0282963 [Amphimedon queenslandica]